MATAPPPLIALRRNRDFRLVWLGQSVSALGNGMTQLAYPLLMLMITGSPAAAGILAALRAVPYVVLGLPAGALVDRWNRRRTMVVCDLIRAVNMATVPAALLLGVLTPCQLYATGLIGGAAYVFFNAAQATCLPNVVPRDQLTPAIAAQETAESACAITAAPIGGALLQWMRGLPFLVDAISFLVSALCFLKVRTDFRGADRPSTAPRPLRAEIVTGLRWLWRNTRLRAIALAAAGLQLAISGVSLVAIVIARDGGAADATVGVLFSAIGAGGVVGAALAPRVRSRFGVGGTILIVLWVHAGTWALLAFAPNLVVVGLCLGLFTVTMPWFGIAAYGYQLEVTPDDLLGRVGTAFSMLLWTATPLSGALVGALLEWSTPRATSLLFAGWVILLAVGCSAAGSLRSTR